MSDDRRDTLAGQMQVLVEAWHDLLYAILRATGQLPRLVRWGGGRPRPWLVNAAKRAGDKL